MTETPKALPGGFDYLGTLSGFLRNMAGYDTLLYELVQNADDARAHSITFDARDDALIVENDSVFSDCGDQDSRICPWKTTKDHSCDFHTLRWTASRNKTHQEDMTGAFGIGFISVYLISDHPRLISVSR